MAQGTKCPELTIGSPTSRGRRDTWIWNLFWSEKLLRTKSTLFPMSKNVQEISISRSPQFENSRGTDGHPVSFLRDGQRNSGCPIDLYT
jgi:hypothetical protein